MRIPTPWAMGLAHAAIASGMASVPVQAADDLWMRYVEPKEHAYTIEVPRGWQVSGGIERRSPMQPHSVLRLTSPHGVAEIVLGNVDAYSYSPLTPVSSKIGFREGMITHPGTDSLRVLNYRTGRQFAELAGRRMFAERCAKLVMVRSREHPGRRPEVQSNGLTQGSTAGDAFFTCEKDGHRLDGYVFSNTEYTTAAGTPGGVWNADNTFSFLTPEGLGPSAGVVLMHVVKSVRIDPQWFAVQLQVSNKLANDALAIANRRLDASVTRMRETFAGGTGERDASQEDMHRLLSGFDEYQTASGDKKTVPYAAATNWWSNGKGQTVGTQGPNAPGINWTEMSRVPPGAR